MRWAQVNVCVLGSFIFPNSESFVRNYLLMRTVHWTGIHIHCSMPAVFNVRSRLPEAVFPLRQSCKSGRSFRVGFGPGSVLSLSKYFGPISGLLTKLFYNINSNNFFSVTYICARCRAWSEVIVISSANSLRKHSCVLLFSGWISLILFLRRQQR